MIEPGDRFRFALETLAPFRLFRGVGWQHLDGDDAPHPGIKGAVDLAHASPAQEADDLVRAQSSAGLQCHGKNAIMRPPMDLYEKKGRRSPAGPVLSSSFRVLS